MDEKNIEEIMVRPYIRPHRLLVSHIDYKEVREEEVFSTWVTATVVVTMVMVVAVTTEVLSY